MNHGSLFSGIGGFDLAAEWMGWNNIFYCEIEPFPRKILNYHFPNSITYEDIKQTDFFVHRGQIDILTGGFPCQPYSAAGQRKGKEDERHLWPEMLRVIREIQPRWVLGENVLGLVNWSEGLVFEEVQLDLEAEGYEVQAFVLPASAKNAPHRRDRVWFVAYSDGTIKGNRCGENNEKKREIRWDDQSNVFGELRGDGNVTNSDSIGTQTRKIGEVLGESDTERQARGFVDESLQGTTTNTNNTRTRESMRTNGEWEKEDKGWEGQSQFEYRENSKYGNVTDTNSERQEWERKQGVITEERERGKKRFEQLGNVKYQWEEFPTQSPICGRDDGISTELDGITFSKWRRESIKGYGNAIVPQVVYEIFKTIEEWERMYL